MTLNAGTIQNAILSKRRGLKMDYISVKKTSERFNVTPRWIQKLCEEGKIAGAVKLDGSNVWMIPADFELHSNSETATINEQSNSQSR